MNLLIFSFVSQHVINIIYDVAMDLNYETIATDTKNDYAKTTPLYKALYVHVGDKYREWYKNNIDR